VSYEGVTKVPDLNRHLFRRLLPSCVVGITLILSACAGPAAAGGATATATRTTAPAACASVPGFEHASAASGGGRFSDVGFPIGAVAYTSAVPEVNGFQFRLVHVCHGGASTDAARAFYSSDLAARGWATSATFPGGGDLSTPCLSPSSCFIKNTGVIRFLDLEDVAATGAATTYTLRLVIQPYAFGSGEVAVGAHFDFDPTGPGGGTDDIIWTGSQLTPTSAAKLIGIGVRSSLNTLSYADLAALSYGTTPIASGALVPGYTFAVATSDGRLVKARVATHAGSRLTVEFVAYPYTF
jgi:hypothetical protein